jgi:hypothetical protein
MKYKPDTGLLLALALCAFSLWPLLYRTGLPNGDDVLYHVYRAAEMERAWTHGVLFPRWAEGFYTGYGSPVFHYYASLSYYLSAGLMRVLGLSALDSFRVLIAVAMLGGAAGMYAFVRGFADRLGGVLAAMAYTYSPYILYTEPYSRGAYPELMAFALFPLVMAAYGRLLRRGGALAFALAALGGAMLIITHNLMALVLTAMLAGWLAWMGAGASLSRKPSGGHGTAVSLQTALWAMGALALGVALAAYFWLPVMREGGAVRLGNLTGGAGVSELDYRRFFVPLDDLLAHSPRVDAGALNGLDHQLNLGLAQWALALAGVIGIAVQRWVPHPPTPSPRGEGEQDTIQVNKRQSSSDRRGVVETGTIPFLRGQRTPSGVGFFALAGLLTVALMLPAAEPVWATLWPMTYLQFPWRFLGPAAFALSVLVGLNTLWIARLPRRIGFTITAALVFGIIALATPLFYVTEWAHDSVDTSVAAYHEQELKGFQRGTTFSNEYLPISVQVEPDATPRLLADYADGYPVNRAHLEALPPGVTLDLLDHGPQHDVWRVNAPQGFTLEVLTYAWEGWTATVDGQPVPITPSNPHGLITFPVAAGEHEVRLTLGSTPARDLGNAVTVLAALVPLGVLVWLRRRHRPLVAVQLGSADADRFQAPLASGRGWGEVHALIVGGLLALVFVAAYMREGGAWVESPPGEARLAQHTLDYQMGDSLRLLGYDLNATTLRPGGRLKLRVYWYASASIPYGYSSFVHLSSGGPPLAQADKLNPAGLPTKTWGGGGYIHDDYVITLPETMPPGSYQLTIGLYTCETRPAGECGNGDRLPVLDANGGALGDAAPLATITVGE